MNFETRRNYFPSGYFGAIESIDRFIEGLSYEAFSQDDKTISAVVRKLEIIGEAAKRIPESTKDAYPDISWKLAAGMRDRLIHAYFEVEAEILWFTIKTSLPPFKEGISRVLNEKPVI